MARLNDRSVNKLRDAINVTDRYAGRPPVPPLSTPSGDKPPFLIGRIDSGPDADGMWTGRLVRYDVFTDEWIVSSQWDVKFLRVNEDDSPPIIGRRYPCRPSHIVIDGADTTQRSYVYNLISTGGGSSQTFVIIDDDLGTGTWQVRGRSLARIATYDADTDSWSYSSYQVLVEPLNAGNFIVNRRYPAWYAGEATGGYDGTGTGTLGTGTGTAGGTVSVYLAEPSGTLMQVVTNVVVECVGGNIVTTLTKQWVIVIQA